MRLRVVWCVGVKVPCLLIENRGVGSSILPLGTILQLLSTFRTRTIRTRRTIRTVST